MLDLLLIIVGSAIVAVVFVDAFMTTLTVSAGAGPLTRVVLGALWRVLLRLHHRNRRSSFLTAAGTLLLGITVLVWVATLWFGWALVFVGSDSVVQAMPLEPADIADVVYFTGATVFTLGTGDFVFDESGWRIVSAAASFTGLFLVTLSITYLVSVLSAVVERRALAIQIHGLGRSTGDIVTNGWDGNRFSIMFQQQLADVTPTIAVSAEQHLAYPVLHYFHSSDVSLEAAVAIAKLDDALLVLEEAVVPECQPQRSAIDPLRFAIERYLTATGSAWSPDVEPPPPPSLAKAIEAGIPLVEATAFAQAVERHRERRTNLRRTVASVGWSWAES